MLSRVLSNMCGACLSIGMQRCEKLVYMHRRKVAGVAVTG